MMGWDIRKQFYSLHESYLCGCILLLQNHISSLFASCYILTLASHESYSPHIQLLLFPPFAPGNSFKIDETPYKQHKEGIQDLLLPCELQSHPRFSKERLVLTWFWKIWEMTQFTHLRINSKRKWISVSIMDIQISATRTKKRVKGTSRTPMNDKISPPFDNKMTSFQITRATWIQRKETNKA